MNAHSVWAQFYVHSMMCLAHTGEKTEVQRNSVTYPSYMSSTLQSWDSNLQTQGHIDRSCMVELEFRPSHSDTRTCALNYFCLSRNYLTPQNTVTVA